MKIRSVIQLYAIVVTFEWFEQNKIILIIFIISEKVRIFIQNAVYIELNVYFTAIFYYLFTKVIFIRSMHTYIVTNIRICSSTPEFLFQFIQKPHVIRVSYTLKSTVVKFSTLVIIISREYQVIPFPEISSSFFQDFEYFRSREQQKQYKTLEPSKRYFRCSDYYLMNFREKIPNIYPAVTTKSKVWHIAIHYQGSKKFVQHLSISFSLIRIYVFLQLQQKAH